MVAAEEEVEEGEEEEEVEPLPSPLGRISRQPRIRCALHTVLRKARTAESFQCFPWSRYPVRL